MQRVGKLDYTYISLMVMAMLSIFGNVFGLETASSPGFTCFNSASNQQAISPRGYRAHLTYKNLKTAAATEIGILRATTKLAVEI